MTPRSAIAKWTIPILITLVATGCQPSDPAAAGSPDRSPAAVAQNAAPEDSANSVLSGQRVDHDARPVDYWAMLFVLVLSTFIGLGAIARVSRLLHTPLMSLTNAISAIAVVGAIIVTGSEFPDGIRVLGAIALFASMTNIVSGFLITDRMLKMFKQTRGEEKR
jgi:NAD(P) transhydrogenase subunit alpha